MENKANHCSAHEDTRERLIKVEVMSDTQTDQIDVLFNKCDSHASSLSSIKLCIERMDAEIKAGFLRQENAILQLTKIVSDNIEHVKELGAERDRQFEEVGDRLKEVEKFKWFRDRLNNLRDNVLVIIFGGGVIILAAIAAVHWADVAEVLRGWYKR